MKQFGMRYEKINHLTKDNILQWVDSNFYGKVVLKPFKNLLDSLPKLIAEREEKEKREAEKKKFEKI